MQNTEAELTKEQLGEGVPFERIRRITGYISGDYVSRFNDGKFAEVNDRMNEHGRTENYHC